MNDRHLFTRRQPALPSKYLALLTATIVSTLLGTSAPAALIVQYSFEETDNTVAPQIVDSIGPVFSNGGQGGGVDLDVDGTLGSGAAFDGVDDVGGTGGASSEFKITSDFTFTTWINLAAAAPAVQARILDSTNSNNAISGAQGWRLMLNNNQPGNARKLQLQARRAQAPAGVINNTFTGLKDVQSEAWTFVALRYDTDGDATISVLYQSDDATAAAVALNSASVPAVGALTYGGAASPRIGANQSGINNFLNGRLDEMTLWDTALTDAELAAVFASTQIPEPASLGLAAVFAPLLLAPRARAR